MTFDFDPALSATENIVKYYTHLESVDAEFATLLKAQLSGILPLSENAPQRAASRQKFNEAVLSRNSRPQLAGNSLRKHGAFDSVLRLFRIALELRRRMGCRVDLLEHPYRAGISFFCTDSLELYRS